MKDNSRVKDSITLPKAAFARVLGGFMPSDDDDSGLVFGPGGPRLRGVFATAWVAQQAIRETNMRLRMVEVLGDGKVSPKQIAAIASQLSADFDDWCGTRPSKWPWPRPKQLEPQDILAFATQLQKAAEIAGPMQKTFQAVADAAFERGLKQLM